MSAQWIKAMLADDAEVDDLGNVVEEGEWINDMKWQHKTDIVKLGDNKAQFVDLPLRKDSTESFSLALVAIGATTNTVILL